jgi:protein-tyrosine phosphatase
MGAERAIRALFICHYNRKRSATAERIFGKDPGLDVRSAGTSSEAMVQVNERMLDWADIVFVMDDEQASALRHSFPTHPGANDAVILHIKDDYHFLDPELVQLLRDGATPHIDRLRAAARQSQSPTES